MGHPTLPSPVILIVCYVLSYHIEVSTSIRLTAITTDRTSRSLSLPDKLPSGGNLGSTEQSSDKSQFRVYLSTNIQVIKGLTDSYGTPSSYLLTKAPATEAPDGLFVLDWWTSSPMFSSILSHLAAPHKSMPGERYDILTQDTTREQRSVVSESTPHNKDVNNRHHNNTDDNNADDYNTDDNNTESVFAGYTSRGLWFANSSVPTSTNNVSKDIQVVSIEDWVNVTTSHLVDNKEAEPAGRPGKTLYIGGLFELSGKYVENGYSELDSALLAVDHINGKGFLPGYTLQLLFNDSKVSAR